MPDPTTDFAIFDAQELVTYEPLAGGSISNVRAVRRPLTQSRQRNIERYIELQPTDVVFHLDNGPLAATSLMAGDSLTDAAAITYMVLFVERQSLKSTVAVVCRPPGV
jgi:hypothetical protein